MGNHHILMEWEFEGEVGGLLWGEWVQGGRSRDYRIILQLVPSGFTIDKVSGR